VTASLRIQHENITTDRWKLMLRVNGVAFAIGAECKTLQEAQRLRFDFRMALEELFAANRIPANTTSQTVPRGERHEKTCEACKGHGYVQGPCGTHDCDCRRGAPANEHAT
jgi:hypothetical protein